MKSIGIIIKSFSRGIGRFPLPVLASVLAFTFVFIELHYGHIGDKVVHDYRYIKLFLECMSAISLYIAFDILAESQMLSRSTRWGLYILGFCILGMHYYSITPGMFADTIFVSRYLIFIVCFHLMVSFVAFHKSTEIDSFWKYNYFLFNQFLISIVYSITLFIGLASCMWALDKLFNIHINPDYYIDLLAFIALVFNTLFFLKGLPLEYAEFSKPMEFKKSIRIFVEYVLLPIVGIYITILYVYMFKIIYNQQLPNGWVCIPILIFSMIGILAYLLIYPIRRNESNASIFMYSKYFFFILLPLLSLYFIAIYKRLMSYGITEERYLIFMLGVWIIIISIYIITSKIDNIIVIPVSLFLLLAVSAIGPWGMFQLSVANQVRRLEHLLKRNHLLENGKLIKLDKKYKVSKEDASSIRSIFSFLNKRGEIDAIHPWLGDEDQAKLSTAIAKNDMVLIQSIFPDLSPIENTPYDWFHFFVSKENQLMNRSIAVEGYKYMTQFNCVQDDTYTYAPIDSTKSITTLKGFDLVFRISKDSLIQISLSEKFNNLLQYRHQADSMKLIGMKESSTLKVINESTQTMEVPSDSMMIYQDGTKLVLSSIEYAKSDTTYIVQHVEGLLLR